MQKPGFLIFVNKSRSKQNKKNPEHIFVDIDKQETCAKFQQKILNSRVARARKVFKFLDRMPGFSKTIELFLNFCMGFCIT